MSCINAAKKVSKHEINPHVKAQRIGEGSTEFQSILEMDINISLRVKPSFHYRRLQGKLGYHDQKRSPPCLIEDELLI